MAASSIVVIEDNEDFATILTTVLSLWSHTVQCHTTIGAGEDRLMDSPPALLILDGQLPDGAGFSLYLRLRANATTSQLPILLLSVSDEICQSARTAADSDPYLFVGLKPIPLGEIETIIHEVIEA